MKFSYNWLKDFVHISKTPKALAELLTLRAFEVSDIAKQGNDTILDIALPPNRVPDASGHIGMAREIASLLNSKFKIPPAKVTENKKQKTKDAVSVTIEDAKGCRRYVGRVIEGITLKDSPEWLRERLRICGIRPINNIVDATNYVMLETGQPLHVFDLNKLEGGKIIVRRARKGETMKTLDRQEVLLTPDDIVIADAVSPIALAGIKGGDKAEIDLKTTAVVLEAANFSGPFIRKTSRRVGIRTDSSYRFEHNLHPDLALLASERAGALIGELSGGVMRAGNVDVYPKKEKERALFVDPARVRSLAGIPISQKIIEGILKRMGIKFTKKRNGLFVMPPLYRRDLEIEEDMIEDILRLFGYEHIPEQYPAIFAPAPRSDSHQWIQLIRKTLQGAGFSEVYRYAFLGERELKLLEEQPDEHIAVENPVSPDLRYVVREPYENMLPFVKSHIAAERVIQIFSIDRGFFKNHRTGGSAEDDFGEEEYLTLMSGSAKTPEPQDAREGFLNMKGALAHLLDSMGIVDYWFDNAPEHRLRYPKLRAFNHMHPYKRAEIKIGEETIGVIGELHPSLISRWNGEARIVVCELFLRTLLSVATSEIEFREIPKFPAMERDIAVLVPQEVRIEEVQGIIENAGGALLEDVDFFDEYSGERIPSRMRSLAFRMVFRDKTRTLKEEEIRKPMENITAALYEKGWEVR